MSKYARVWTVVAAAVCAAGFASAVDGWPLVVVLATSLTGGMLGVTMALPWLPWSSSWAVAVIKVMATSFIATWVLMGVAHLAGVAGLVVAIAVALGCPELGPSYSSLASKVGWHRPRRRQTRSASAGTDDEVARVTAPAVCAPVGPVTVLDGPTLDVPDLMTTEDLCQAWRSSYVALQRSMTTDSRLRVVSMRALYLDELERRSESAVQAWLSSGARAASDPARFLTGSRRWTPGSLIE